MSRYNLYTIVHVCQDVTCTTCYASLSLTLAVVSGLGSSHDLIGIFSTNLRDLTRGPSHTNEYEVRQHCALSYINVARQSLQIQIGAAAFMLGL